MPVPPSPAIAALLATVLPGGGQFYLGDTEAGVWTVATEASLVGTAALLPGREDELDLLGGGGTFELTPRRLALETWSKLHVYTVYAAYRDAWHLRNELREAPPLPGNSASDMLSAPVRPSVALSPEVALPVLTLVTMATAAALLANSSGSALGLFESGSVEILGSDLSPGAALAAQTPVHGALSMGAAVSEEGLFRGMMQHSLMRWMSPGPAIATQATLFGAAHIPNAFILPFRPEDRLRIAVQQFTVTTLLGGWMGYLAWRDQGDLSRAVAFHFWYDILIMTLGFATEGESWPFRFTLAVPF